MKRIFAGMLLASLAFAVFAAGKADVRKQAQASMLVTGSIEINPDGSVKSYALDKPDKLPPVVVTLLGENVPKWKFQPVMRDGIARTADAKMSLRIVAKPLDDEHSTIGISGAQFGDGTADRSLGYKDHESPRYPELSRESRVSGEVYLLALVNRQGGADSVMAEQVNLFVYADERDMDRYRNDLANAAIKAVKHWTFRIPTAGEHANDSHWVVRIPVNFQILAWGETRPSTVYGQWKAYIPGPRQFIPWQDKKLLSDSADAQADGTLDQLGSGPRLMTPLGGA